jgi:transcriptional regulator with XRE-family HTH domain
VDEQPALGLRVRELRVERGLRQADLAGDRVTVAYVSMVEAGKRTPGLEVLTHFAQRLGCSVAELQGQPAGGAGWRLAVDYAELALHNGEPDEALARTTEVLDAIAAGDQGAADAELVRRAGWTRARALESRGDLLAAAQAMQALHEQALESGSGDPVAAMHLAVAWSRCLTQLGDVTGAQRVVVAARAAAAETGLQASDGYAELTSTLMALHYMRNEIDAAGEVADELITLVDQGGTRRARAAAYWNAAGVAEARGDLPGAVSLSQRAVALLAEDDDERMLARARTASAWFLLRADRGRAAEALTLLGQAREVFERTGSATDLATARVEAGHALVILGLPEEALAEADAALELLGEDPQSESSAAWLSRATALVALDRPDEARLSAARAESCLRELPATRWTLLGFRELGQVHESLGDTTLALNAYREALAVGAATPSPGAGTHGERAGDPARRVGRG